MFMRQNRFQVGHQVEERVSFNRLLNVIFWYVSPAWYYAIGQRNAHEINYIETYAFVEMYKNFNVNALPIWHVFFLVGGKRTQPGEFPHMVSIIYKALRATHLSNELKHYI